MSFHKQPHKDIDNPPGQIVNNKDTTLNSYIKHVEEEIKLMDDSIDDFYLWLYDYHRNNYKNSDFYSLGCVKGLYQKWLETRGNK